MKKKKYNEKIRWKQILPFYIMLVPGFAYLLMNNYIPMAGLVMAFQKVNFNKGIFGGDWVGLENFKFLFKSSDIWLIIRNTLGYNLIFLAGGPVLGILVAVFLNEVKQRIPARIYQTVILLPYLISITVLTYLAYAFLSNDNGMLNKIVLPFLGKDPVQWYGEVKYWPAILIFINFWKSFGFSSVIYLASIVGINMDYYEAASLDGASKWKQFTMITLPLLKPTIITLTIIGLGGIFRSDFGLFYQVPLNNGALFKATQTIDTYVFRGLTSASNLGLSAAAGFLQSFIGFLTVMAANLVIRKISESDALF